MRKYCNSSRALTAWWLVAVALAAPAAQAVEASGAPLTGDAVRQLLLGNTLTGSYGARPYTFYYESESKVYGTLGLHGADSGAWSVKDDKYCHFWNEYFGATERCYRVYLKGGDGYLLKNADAYRWHDVEGRVLPGKPKGF